MIDITDPEIVEISIREDGKVLWINVDQQCVLRVNQIKSKDRIIIDNQADETEG